MNHLPIDTYYFAFERDFVDSLRCIPMIVRYKLDISHIKLKLHEWVKLSQDEKANLANWSCFTDADILAYRAYLVQLVQERCAHPVSELGALDPSWENSTQVPDKVQQKVLDYKKVQLAPHQWAQLAILQRFALVKLSRSNHDGRNFPRALAEFGLIGESVSTC